MPPKRIEWKKIQKFYKLLREGKAPLGKSRNYWIKRRRGKGAFKELWIKEDGTLHWGATNRFNKLFREMIKAGSIIPKHFEFHSLPLYFAEMKPPGRAVSHYIKGIDLGKSNSEIAKAFKAPVAELKSEVEESLDKALVEGQRSDPDIFLRFSHTNLSNVMVESYNPKTKRFKIFVVDV